MKTCHALALVLIFAILAVTSLPAQEQENQEHEKRIDRSALPSAVENTVAANTQGATIRGFNEEKENGKTYYEAELTVNGHSKDILMDSDGAIVEVEEQVDLASLPAAVQRGLQAKAGGGKLGKVESITKHSQLVAYEAKVTSHGKRSEIQVGPDGKSLAH
jgi:preprotein translocase subunit YajC